MKTKPGVDISKLHPELTALLPVVDNLWNAVFPDDSDGALITSGNEGSPGDGVHGDKSKHYPANNDSGKGEAIDIRLNDVLQWKATYFCGLLMSLLSTNYPSKYSVFCEKLLTPAAHCHIQFR
jgi:hypothetical protein